MPASLIRPTPWDAAALGMPTRELLECSAEALRLTEQTPGHYSIKVDPLSDKGLLHKFGFYYCDTLIEPECTQADLRPCLHADASLSRQFDADQVMAICHGAFTHGRFHRDFNLSPGAADLRYDRWLQQLIEQDQVDGLYWQDQLAGFVAYNGGNLVLHALAQPYRGRGLTRHWWSLACRQLFQQYSHVGSSVSAVNFPMVALHSSLGFRFSSAHDIYHKLVS